MCTNPITITRNYPSIGERTYQVPCGKCAECVRKKQSEFAALALHQAIVSGSCHFFTFTYSNLHCPIAITEMTSEEKPVIVGFSRGCDSWLTNGSFMNAVHRSDSLCYTPSLCREDVKLVLKHFRSYWKEQYPDEELKFKYAVFGEYGEMHGRPHYHGLFYGLTPHQALFLVSIWRERFGYCLALPEGNPSLGLDELQKVSLYCSKYISKADFSRWKDIIPYVEKPRRQSSLDFGSFSDSELVQLASFMMDAICYPDPERYLDYPNLISFLASCLDVNLLRLLDMISPSPNV